MHLCVKVVNFQKWAYDEMLLNTYHGVNQDVEEIR